MNAMNTMPMMNGPMMPMGMMGNQGGMPMMNGMMPGMGMGMMPMMNGMMPGMGMMMPMMMSGMMPMMCKMSCEMTKDGMVMKMMPTDASMMPRMKERCEAMQSMMAMGAPMMMMCGGMPMMMCMPTTTSTKYAAPASDSERARASAERRRAGFLHFYGCSGSFIAAGTSGEIGGPPLAA